MSKLLETACYMSHGLSPGVTEVVQACGLSFLQQLELGKCLIEGKKPRSTSLHFLLSLKMRKIGNSTEVYLVFT